MPVPAARCLRRLLASALATAGLAAQAGQVPGESLDSLLAYARANNPELRALAADAEGAQAQVGAAGALPDPRFQVELMDFGNRGSGGGASLLPGDVGVTRYRVIQPLPFYGKRALRSELAGHMAARGRAGVEAARVEIEAGIASAYLRHYGAVEQARIQRETLDLLQALERLVLTRYGVGLVPQQDALRAQAEITAVKIDLLATERQLREARAALNAALPRPAEAPLQTPAALPPLDPLPALAELLERARSRAPQIAQLEAEAELARAQRDLVYRERYPDLAVGLTNNRPREGDATWDLMLEVNIPLQQDSRRSSERGAELGLQAARARVEAEEARVGGRLGRALAAFEAARDTSEMLHDTLLPQARANLQAAEAGYESGRVNFDTLIEAERRILRTRLDLLQSQIDVRLQRFEIERLVGERL